MYKKALILIFILCWSSHLLTAQKEAFDVVYKREVIGYYGSRYIINTQVLSFREIKPLLLKYPSSATEINLSQKKLRTGFLFYGIGLAGLLIAPFQVDKNTGLAAGLLGGGLCSLCISIPFLNRSQRHQQRSVYLYNFEILQENFN